MSQQIDQNDIEDPYALLNIPIDADQKQIKDKYYEYSRVFHPDKQQSTLYLESRAQFEQIDKAYKAISNPFFKLIYDNFGYSGVQISIEHQNKFIDLEEQYVQTYEQRIHHKHEYKLRLQQLKKEIIQRMNHLYDLYREEKSFINCYKTIQINADFSAIQFLQQQHNANSSFSEKQLLLTRLSFIPMLYLPDIKKYQIQHEIGFTASAAGIFGQQQDFNGGCLYKISKKISDELKYIGGSDARLSLFHSYKSTEGTLELSTTPYKDLNVTYSARIGKFGVLPIVTFNRNINDTLSVTSQVTLVDGISDVNFGLVKVLKNPKLRLDFDGNINEHELNTEFMVGKDINKRFQVVGGVVQKGEKKANYWKLKVYACVGWKYVFSSNNFIEIRSCFGMGNNEIQIRLKRNGMLCSLPISLGPFPSVKSVGYSLMSGLLSGYAMYKITQYRKSSAKNQMIIIKKNKNRLLDEKKIFNTHYSDINYKNEENLNLEISNHGLVILKAYGGDQKKISAIKKVFQMKENKLPYLRNEDVLRSTLSREVDIGYDLGDVLCEVVEVTGYIQNLVRHSYIDASYTEVANQQGLFNPCIDNSSSTSIFIQYSYKGEVKEVIIKSGDQLSIGNINTSSRLSRLLRAFTLNQL